jgi:hypothetical protein
MCRARKVGVATPTPYHVNSQHSLVFCERVEGDTLQQRLAEAQGEGAAGEDEGRRPMQPQQRQGVRASRRLGERGVARSRGGVQTDFRVGCVSSAGVLQSSLQVVAV